MSAQQTETTPQWQLAIAEQLEQIGVTEGTTHLVVHIPENGDAVLLDLCDSETGGVISAQDHATKVDGGEVSVVPLATIQPLIGLTYHADEPLADEQPEPQIPLKPNADTGELFNLPRPAVVIDDSDPNVLKLSFSGGVEIERGDKAWVDWFNRLREGRTGEIRVGLYVAGAAKTHRRDKDGNVDSTVLTKSVTVTDVYLDDTTTA